MDDNGSTENSIQTSESHSGLRDVASRNQSGESSMVVGDLTHSIEAWRRISSTATGKISPVVPTGYTSATLAIGGRPIMDVDSHASRGRHTTEIKCGALLVTSDTLPH